MRGFGAAVGFAVALTAAGCGADAETFFPVAGAVTIAGKPLASGTVTFLPDAARGNASRHHPIGVIDARGNYVLWTVGQKGAPRGWYKVVVHADENQQSGKTAAPLPPKWLTHVRYTTEAATPLKVEVVDGPSAGSYDLTLMK